MNQRVRDYLILTKFRLVLLATFATLAGFLMGSPAAIDGERLIWTLLGAFLVGTGSNALNQWWEREPDARMARTRTRPLPAGRMAPREALIIGVGMVGIGIGWLGWHVNSLAAWLAVVTVVSYVGVYTPLKRVSSFCTLAGAVPGALPPVIGWAAARGSLGLEAWVLFGILFLWQLPHFLSLAWVHRTEYAHAGFRMLPVADPEGLTTARQILIYGCALVPTSLLPAVIGAAGQWYFWGALLAGVWFLCTTILAVRTRSPALTQRVFYASLGYLPLIMTLMVLDKTPV